MSARLYVDASRSMAGFVRSGERTAFGKTIEQFTMELDVDSLFRFGGGAGSLIQPVLVARDIHEPDFYTLSHNPDQVLFRHFAADTLGNSYVYFTDGVLSAVEGQPPSASLRPIKQYLNQGGAFAILAFRGPFRGRGWSEEQQRWVGEIDVEARPFYAFLFAPSEATLSMILEEVGDITDSAVLLRFDSALIRCRVSWDGLPLFTHAEVSAGSHWLMLDSGGLTHLRDQREGKLVDYVCASASTPLAVVHARVEARYARATPGGQSFSVLSSRINGEPVSELFEVSEAGPGPAAIRATFGDDPQTRFGFFELTFQNRPGPLRADVLALGADSDAQPENFDGTYRLIDVIRKLARDQVARSHPAPPLYLTVQYR